MEKTKLKFMQDFKISPVYFWDILYMNKNRFSDLYDRVYAYTSTYKKRQVKEEYITIKINEYVGQFIGKKTRTKKEQEAWELNNAFSKNHEERMQNLTKKK